MIVFPQMLSNAAEQAGMKIPPSLGDKDFDVEACREAFPHFFVFCCVQLGRPCRHGEHFENAKVIARLTDEQIVSVTLKQLIELGLEYYDNAFDAMHL